MVGVVNLFVYVHNSNELAGVRFGFGGAMERVSTPLQGPQLPLFGSLQSRTVVAPERASTQHAEVKSLTEAAAAYCLHLAGAGRAIHTVRSTELDLHGVIEHLGEMPLSSVTPNVLGDHLRWLKMERHNGTASLRRKIATLKGLFRHAVQQGWLHDNPSDSLAYPPPVRPPLIVLTPSEADRVAEAAVHDPIWHALVLLLLDAGLKRDEALALRAEDLGLARNPGHSHVAVRRAGASKRVRRRVVPLTARAHAALVRLLTAPLPGERLISLSVRGVNFVVETVGQRAGITRVKKLTPEILRDTFAVEHMRGRQEAEAVLAGNGLPPPDLGRLRRDHDAEVLQLLGLSPHSEMAIRYRAAAAAAREATAPSPTAARADNNVD